VRLYNVQRGSAHGDAAVGVVKLDLHPRLRLLVAVAMLQRDVKVRLR
jgi:hypothetical protein